MSQSDYIRYKKISNKLLEVNKINSILDSQEYTDFKQYYLESNIVNTKPLLNKLDISGKSVIFDMKFNIKYCPKTNFTMCNKTANRSNRINTVYHPSDAHEVNQYPIKKIV